MNRLTAAAFAIGACFLAPVPARAHFILQAPESWADQDGSGLPQKSAPCGQADQGTPANPTGIVTAFAPGDTVTVTINETVTHPGHYRVALSTTGQSGLPADPAVTPVGADACGSTVVENPPVFPVIADGMLEHTSAFSGPQSFAVTLPAGVTCTSNCVLQVIEYMSSHGAPCFYHHCADITIQAGGGGDAGSVPPHDEACGCALRGSPASTGVVLLVAALVLARRRRARR